MAKHDISLPDLEMLLYLYSELYFTIKDFDRIDKLMSWDSSRFSRLKKTGWIELWRAANGNKPARYQLSLKATRIVGDFYRMLDGDKIYSSHRNTNPIFDRANCQNNDRYYRAMFDEMNEDTRRLKQKAILQQQHQPHEL